MHLNKQEFNSWGQEAKQSLVPLKSSSLPNLSVFFFVPPQGMNLAKDIRDRERGGRAQVTVVEADDEKSSEQAVKLMKQHLGDKREIKNVIIPDDVVDSKLRTSIKLFQSVPALKHSVKAVVGMI